MLLEKLRILVADASVVSRKHITDVVNATEYGIALHTAPNPQICLEWLKQSDIDLVIMDIALVREAGLDFVRQIKRQFPRVSLIIMSDHSPQNASLTLEAINAGALDFILNEGASDAHHWQKKIKGELDAIFLQTKVGQYLTGTQKETATVHAINGKPAAEKSSESSKSSENAVVPQKNKPDRIDLVLIASSTGGPLALDAIISQLPRDLGKPVLIVQHMPPGFTAILAGTLDKKYPATVTEAKDGDLLQDSVIAIAPGGYHMVLGTSEGTARKLYLTDAPFVNGVRPAADVLFESVAKNYKGMQVLAVVLTGMGNDGTKGIRALKSHCNCYCLTQSESSCVVYGMPKCVVEAGLSDEQVELKGLAARIQQLVSGGR